MCSWLVGFCEDSLVHVLVFICCVFVCFYVHVFVFFRVYFLLCLFEVCSCSWWLHHLFACLRDDWEGRGDITVTVSVMIGREGVCQCDITVSGTHNSCLGRCYFDCAVR